MTDHFSFRWGIPILDSGDTRIPNFILAVYSEIEWTDKDGNKGKGISNTEMMFIVHLASFKYESPRGSAEPALTSTLKDRMGYKSNRGITKVCRGLEHKNLLTTTRRSGQTSIYDFGGFSLACLEAATKMEMFGEQGSDQKVTTSSDQKVTGGSDQKVTTVVTKSSNEEENKKKRKKKREEESKRPVFSSDGKDPLALAAGISEQQRRQIEPISVIAEKVASLLGTTVPGYEREWNQKWEPPISEWLKLADVDRVLNDVSALCRSPDNAEWIARATTPASLSSSLRKRLNGNGKGKVSVW